MNEIFNVSKYVYQIIILKKLLNLNSSTVFGDPR